MPRSDPETNICNPGKMNVTLVVRCLEHLHMKTPPILFMTAAILLGLDATPALAARPSNVTIQYVTPEKFADFRIHGRDAQWSASYFTSQISDYLRPMLNRRFPGAKLTLRFTDIDLAGSNRNSSRGGSNVRVNRGTVTPARMSFVFLLQDSSGRTLANGSTRITDNSNPNSLARPRSGSQPLYSEKQMLEKWLRSVKTS
jgi:Protein of unknown function (DUF3016)